MSFDPGGDDPAGAVPAGREPGTGDLRDAVLFLALGGGAGLSPWVPGTCGTLIGVALHAALTATPGALHAVLAIALLAAGIPICGAAARRLGQHDHPAIVWDEIACVPVALAGLPIDWAWLAAGFLAFRLFDIVKPWPISLVDRHVGGGVGIMADDLLAAVCAAAVLHAGGWALGL